MVSFSISILTKGRLDCLVPLFAAVERERRDNPAIPCEVNIIDDSTLEDQKRIQEMCTESSFNYYYFEGGISPKRNEAVRRATKEFIWFVDSDCEPQEGVLKAYADTFAHNNVGGALGVVIFEGKKPFFWSVIEEAGFTTTFSFANFMDYALWGPCANICFRKKDLEAIGGFKEEPPYNYSAEDVDVGLRLNKGGFRIKCNSHAVVHHSTSTWLPVIPLCRKVFRWGRTDYHLMRDHYDMTFPEYLRFPLMFMFVCLAALIPGVTFRMPLLFLLLTPILLWLYRLLERKSRIRDFFRVFVAFYLKQWYETGFVAECLRHLRFNYLFKKILYGNPQLSFEIPDRTAMAVAMLLSLILSFFLGQ